jgi:signal transduction histidine kinase
MRSLGDVCAKLRRWPRRISPDHRSLAQEVLERSCMLFEAPRALVVIDDGDQPWLNIASLTGREFTWREEEDLSLESVVDVELADRAFFVGADGMVACAGGRPMRIDAAIDVRIRSEMGAVPLLSVPIVADALQGRLFVLDPGLDPEICLAVAEPLSGLLGIKFEASAELRNAVREAVGQDRTRVARDLHDGLLQSFTGVVLQLETVHSMFESDPQNAKRMITETQGLIMSDQRELRQFVEQLRPRPSAPESQFDLAARMEDLRSRFSNQWGIEVKFDVQNVDPVVSGFIGQETFRLIAEAVTNSAKHGRATDVSVGLRTAGSEMQIEVADNGTGFPFHGRRTLDQLRDSGEGPIVLAERVSSLNGNLTVDSTESGATVTMTVPLGFGA